MAWVGIEFEVTTPMFLGRGHSAQGHAEADALRVPSLRGALRYWFRAFAGDAIGEDTGRMFREEAKIFGAAAGSGDGLGASPVRMRLRATPQLSQEAHPAWLLGNPGVGYLLGPGLFKAGSRGNLPGVSRGFLEPTSPPRTATQRARGSGLLEIDPGPHGEVLGCCLWVLAIFGGLGARVRRGFGGITFGAGLEAIAPGLAGELQPFSRDGWILDPRLISKVQNHFSRESGLNEGPALPETAPSAYPRFASGEWKCRGPITNWEGWEHALSAVGMAFREHRTYAPPYRAAFPSYRRRVTHEYEDVVVAAWKGENVTNREFRLGAFGLPIIFRESPPPRSNPPGKSPSARQSTVEPASLRRASPLWIRPFSPPGGPWYVLHHAFLGQFLPDDAPVQIDGSNLKLDRAMVKERVDEWLGAAP